MLKLRSRALKVVGSDAPWYAGLATAHGGRVPRDVLDGPLVVALLSGALMLAVHASAGAVALPAMLWPPRRSESRAGQLERIEDSLAATREERRALAAAPTCYS